MVGLPVVMPWLAVVAVLYLAGPFIALLPQIDQADWGQLMQPALRQAVLTSLVSATVATLLVALVGVPLGLCLARGRGMLWRLAGVLVQLPLALPPLASGILLLFLLGPNGRLGQLAGGRLTDSFIGIVLAEAFVAAPFLIIATRSAFAALDPGFAAVAATLGHGAWSRFRRISLPLIWPALRAGLLLTWLRAFGEFGATVMVAYHPFSLPIYTYVAFGGQGLPAMLPILLPTLLLAGAVIGLSAALAQPRRLRVTVDDADLPLAEVPARPASVPPPGDFSFALRQRLGSFSLDLAWSPTGRRLALLGASGSGKSLTLRGLAGLEATARADLRLGSRLLSGLPPQQRGIAYLPQSFALAPHLSVRRQLLLPVGADPARLSYWLERLQLAGLADRLPGELSVGQQQRVALARALMRPHELLLLDEPLSALDAPLRRSLSRLLRQLQADVGAVSLLVTHDIDEVAWLADELLVLGQGRVLQQGRVAEVIRRPASAAVARLLGASYGADGVAAAGQRIDVGGGVLIAYDGPPMPPGCRLGWTVAPAQIVVRPGGRYPVALLDQLGLGDRRELRLALGQTEITALVGDGLDLGAPLAVDIDPAALTIWPT